MCAPPPRLCERLASTRRLSGTLQVVMINCKGETLNVLRTESESSWRQIKQKKTGKTISFDRMAGHKKRKLDDSGKLHKNWTAGFQAAAARGVAQGCIDSGPLPEMNRGFALLSNGRYLRLWKKSSFCAIKPEGGGSLVFFINHAGNLRTDKLWSVIVNHFLVPCKKRY